MIPPELRIHPAGIAAVILRVALDRIVAFNEVGIVAAGAGEKALRLADAGILVEILGKLRRLLVGTGMLVAHGALLHRPNAWRARGFLPCDEASQKRATPASLCEVNETDRRAPRSP